MSIQAAISVGEFLDKLCILRIKAERIKDRVKLDRVIKEMLTLDETWERSPYASLDLQSEISELRRVNERLWEIEDQIRVYERREEFGPGFIDLARSVYLNNDERAAIKRRINERSGSLLVEEKSYQEYTRR
jgi:Family of unknown function (DUF6165)